jgi:hypothetical protein
MVPHDSHVVLRTHLTAARNDARDVRSNLTGATKGILGYSAAETKPVSSSHTSRQKDERFTSAAISRLHDPNRAACAKLLCKTRPHRVV